MKSLSKAVATLAILLAAVVPSVQVSAAETGLDRGCNVKRLRLHIDPCGGTLNRYLPYNYDLLTESPGVPIPPGSSIFDTAACSIRLFHANYAGLAVGQLRNFGTKTSHGTCDYTKVRVTTGAFQNGVNKIVQSGQLKQSLKTGSVLFVRYETRSPWGLKVYHASWANSTTCSA